MPEPIVVYGDHVCEDTELAVTHLNQRGIKFRMVFIEEAPFVEQFVEFINGGNRSTPTIVFGGDKRKLVLTEPTIDQLEEGLRWAGYYE
jgi:mycoredoxin